MKTYRTAFTDEEYDSYRSEDLSSEKVLKALKILFSGRELTLAGAKYALFETVNGGFDVVEVLKEDKIINPQFSFSTICYLINRMDDKELDDQHTLCCMGEALTKHHQRNRPGPKLTKGLF